MLSFVLVGGRPLPSGESVFELHYKPACNSDAVEFCLRFFVIMTILMKFAPTVNVVTMSLHCPYHMHSVVRNTHRFCLLMS